MWIRGQKRNVLLECVYFDIEEQLNSDYAITTTSIDFPMTTLGTYATKKRALEVLDEIERNINGYYTYEEEQLDPSSNIVYKIKVDDVANIVYQMPKE